MFFKGTVNDFGFHPDIKVTEVLGKASFTISAEIIPPRNGAEQALILGQIQSLIQSGAQFLSVTKGAGGSLRGGSLPIAQSIKERFRVPCIAHFTCRDITPQEVENQLIDHHYFGVRNILALRGDPPMGHDTWNSKDGSYPYAYQLIEQIAALNQGKYLERKGFTSSTASPTDFCIGAAVYPEHVNESERISFFEQKIRAGASYAITQMLFDPEAYARFVDACAKKQIHVPILPGSRIVKSQKQALAMAKRFEVGLSKEYFNDLPEVEEEGSFEKSVEAFLKMTERLKSLGAPGIHLFVLSDTRSACQVLGQLVHSREIC